ncbi:MAG: homoserine dehydrogenase [Spirochaetia bacterium]|nr:homoserine dehydrogenase [Spirochaetia bacterium]
MNIAIVGLGRIGTSFINRVMDLKSKGIYIIAASENEDTEGKKAAMAKQIQILTPDEITTMGDYLDIIFDLTGNPKVRKDLRDGLKKRRNTYTVIAPENIVHLLWAVMEDKALPDVHLNKGY